jgi:hypothetical protein
LISPCTCVFKNLVVAESCEGDLVDAIGRTEFVVTVALFGVLVGRLREAALEEESLGRSRKWGFVSRG